MLKSHHLVLFNRLNHPYQGDFKRKYVSSNIHEKRGNSLQNFSELKCLPLRDIWPHEASDFTPWLASNIQTLGAVLGMDIEFTDREAEVGDFSLDLLAKDLGSSRTLIIENQFGRTDHDHLGKLLTYAAGYDASIVIWLSEEVRDEHRQALEWLNQRTDIETQFFAIVVEVLQIDDSQPALNFKIVVSPNAWEKSKRREISTTSVRSEKYRSYFQELIDELRERHNFTNARVGQPQNWYSFSARIKGFEGIWYHVNFGRNRQVYTTLYIDFGTHAENKNFFDALKERETEINVKFSTPLHWERNEKKRMSTIRLTRDGDIHADKHELEAIKAWQIENLLKFKEVFTPEIELVREKLSSREIVLE